MFDRQLVPEKKKKTYWQHIQFLSLLREMFKPLNYSIDQSKK